MYYLSYFLHTQGVFLFASHLGMDNIGASICANTG